MRDEKFHLLRSNIADVKEIGLIVTYIKRVLVLYCCHTYLSIYNFIFCFSNVLCFK